MRSIVLILFETTAESIALHLDRFYQRDGICWLLRKTLNDPILYLDIGPLESTFSSPEEQAAVRTMAVGRQFVVVSADISGRHGGDQEVVEFVGNLLTTFNGLAYDDYTMHAWSLEEIRAGIMQDGHPFFDYEGWYNDRRSAHKTAR